MLLYVLRHGHAEERAKSGRDADRELTSEGADKVRAVVRRAQSAGFAPSVILSSPYVRSYDSARVAAKLLDHTNPILTSLAFTPAAEPQEAWDEIRLHRSEASALVVTHIPICGLLMAHLLDTPSLIVNFRKAAMVCLNVDAGVAHPRATLEWMITAKLA